MDQMIMAYQGEMALKGLNRKNFEHALIKNIKHNLKDIGKWEVRSSQSTIYIKPMSEQSDIEIALAYERCARVFGIASLSKSAVCKKTMEDIEKTVLSYLQPSLEKAKTFKVAAKRADKTFPLKSLELSRELGGVILEHFPHLKVDVKTPEITVMVEVREQAAYVHADKEKGAGGLPVSTSGRAVLMLSGGIDSPVAGWQMAKRGLALVAVHFASPPYTSPRARAKVEDLALLMTPWTGSLPLYIVPYTKAQEYLKDNLRKPEYFTVMMRRSMMRIAKLIAEKETCEAMITGESLAQVASQTMQAIACTDSTQSLPILRPCIGMDKTEIVEIARHIGTFETSILPYEDCCTIFTPPHPVTKPKLDVVEELEKYLPELAELEKEAAQNAEFSLKKMSELEV